MIVITIGRQMSNYKRL